MPDATFTFLRSSYAKEDHLDQVAAVEKLAPSNRPKDIRWGEISDCLFTKGCVCHDEEEEEVANPLVQLAVDFLVLCQPTCVRICSRWEGLKIAEALPQLVNLKHVEITWMAYCLTCTHGEGRSKSRGADCRTLLSSLQACPSLEKVSLLPIVGHVGGAIESLFCLMKKSTLREICLRTVNIVKLESGRIKIRIKERLKTTNKAEDMVKAVNCCVAAGDVSHLEMTAHPNYEGVQQKLVCLDSCATLEELSVDVDALSDCGRTSICPNSCLKKLTLIFHNNDEHCKKTPLFEAVSVALREQPHLVELSIGWFGVNLKDPLELQHFPAFADALRRHSCLRTLGFASSSSYLPRLGPESLLPLFQAVGQSKSLKAMSFSKEIVMDADGLVQGLAALKRSATFQLLSIGLIRKARTDNDYFRVDTVRHEASKALQGNLSVTSIHESNPRRIQLDNPRRIGWNVSSLDDDLACVLRRNELLRKGRAHAKSQFENNRCNTQQATRTGNVGCALLPHLFCKLGSNKGEGTPLFSFLRENEAMVTATVFLKTADIRKRKSAGDPVWDVNNKRACKR